MSRFIYHYCARAVTTDKEHTFDGIAQMETRIVTMEDYRALKELICEASAKRNWCITSLSFLGMAKSKVAQAKEDLQWQKFGPVCSNCASFTSKIIANETSYGSYLTEKDKRCTKGNFVTGKACWCPAHKFMQ